VRVGALLGDAKSSLDDAKSLLGDAKSSLGDAKSSLGDAESSLGDAESSLGDAESSHLRRQDAARCVALRRLLQRTHACPERQQCRVEARLECAQLRQQRSCNTPREPRYTASGIRNDQPTTAPS
jgi:hypothetical protein